MSTQDNNFSKLLGTYSLTAAGTFVEIDNSTSSSPFNCISINPVSLGSGGSVIVEGCNEPPSAGTRTWMTVRLAQILGSNDGGTLNTGTINFGSIPCAFVRVRLSGTITGTYTISIFLTKNTPNHRTVALSGHLNGSTGGSYTGNPIQLALCARTTNAPVNDLQAANMLGTQEGALVSKPYSIPTADWSYAAAAGGITNTTEVVMKTAAGATLKNYITGLQIANASATATDIQIKDDAGGTVIWRGYVQANQPLTTITLPSTIKTSLNKAVVVACGTAGAAVYINAQGYVAV
jgi:hypothetical protein